MRPRWRPRGGRPARARTPDPPCSVDLLTIDRPWDCMCHELGITACGPATERTLHWLRYAHALNTILIVGVNPAARLPRAGRPARASRRVCAASARLGEIFPRCRMVLDTGEKSPRGQQALRSPCALVMPDYHRDAPRARISPCRVIQSTDWEREQELRELTLEDALQCNLARTSQGRQRQAAMGDPSRRDQGLSGDVR